ncbi:ArdC family protein, partial [Enterococcus sp. C76]
MHLKEGISAYLESDTFKNYLNFISQFHKYSSKNVRLILEQKPDARYVASFKKWNEMERKVKKGSKAIYVYAPSTVIKKDKDGNPVKDENGNIIKEQRFFLVPVFDVSQTQGEKEIPKPVYHLEDNLKDPKRFSQLFKGLSELSPVPVKIEAIDSEANGFYRVEEKEIIIQEGLGHEMTLKTLAHEIA